MNSTTNHQLAEIFKRLPNVSTWSVDDHAAAREALAGATGREIALAMLDFIHAHAVAAQQATLPPQAVRATPTPAADDEALALNQLIAAAEHMLRAGCRFAREDDPEAFAGAARVLRPGTVPRLEVTLGESVSVVGTAIDGEGEPVVHLFAMTARRGPRPGPRRAH